MAEHDPLAVRITLERSAIQIQAFIDETVSREAMKEAIQKAVDAFDFQAEVEAIVRVHLSERINQLASYQVRCLLDQEAEPMGRKVAELMRGEIRRQLDLVQGERL